MHNPKPVFPQEHKKLADAMKRIPETRAEAESAVEKAIGDLLARSGGDVDRDIQVYTPAFWPLARFLYGEEIRGSGPFLSGDDAMVQVLREAATTAVNTIVSPEAIDPLTPDVPYDEWWRFAPPGFRKLSLTERNRIRNLLYEFVVKQELPYWVNRLKSQSATGGGWGAKKSNLTPAESVPFKRATEAQHIESDSQYSGQHRARFLELRAVGEVYALNLHPEYLPFGPWALGSDIRGDDAAERLKSRFRAAVRNAAISAGAPARVTLLDWWICRLVREKKEFRLEGVIQRSN